MTASVIVRRTRAPTAYNLFVKNNFASVKQEFPNMTPQDHLRRLGLLWKQQKSTTPTHQNTNNTKTTEKSKKTKNPKKTKQNKKAKLNKPKKTKKVKKKETLKDLPVRYRKDKKWFVNKNCKALRRGLVSEFGVPTEWAIRQYNPSAYLNHKLYKHLEIGIGRFFDKESLFSMQLVNRYYHSMYWNTDFIRRIMLTQTKQIYKKQYKNQKKISAATNKFSSHCDQIKVKLNRLTRRKTTNDTINEMVVSTAITLQEMRQKYTDTRMERIRVHQQMNKNTLPLLYSLFKILGCGGKWMRREYPRFIKL